MHWASLPTRHPRVGEDPWGLAVMPVTSALSDHPLFAFTASQRGPLARPPQGHPTTRPFGFAALLGLAGAGRTRLCEPQTGCRSVSCQSCATRPSKRDEPECTLNHRSIRPTALAEYSVALPDFMGRTKKPVPTNASTGSGHLARRAALAAHARSKKLSIRVPRLPPLSSPRHRCCHAPSGHRFPDCRASTPATRC